MAAMMNLVISLWICSAAMIDGMIERINGEMGKELPVYVTGGLAPIVLPHCRHEMAADELLVLKGLYQIYRKNK